MSVTNQRAFLRSQIVEMDRLLAIAGDHPAMVPALKQRRAAFEQQLTNAPGMPQPRVILFFTGEPVLGSKGIDAQFAISVLQPFLEMVKTEYVASKHGRVGQRGPRRDEDEARLLLTGLPRGSFGLELSKPDSPGALAGEHLSEALVHLTDLIKSAGTSDEGLAIAFEKVSPRVLARLKDFFRVVAESKAGLKVASGDLEVRLDPAEVQRGFERVNSTETNERTEDLPGVFRGATLDTWRFDFKPAGGETISGRLGHEVAEDEVTRMLELTNQSCVARMKETEVVTRSGLRRVAYELLALARPELRPA